MKRDLARIAIVAAAYYGSAKFGLDLASTNRSVTAVWAPTGIALAALLLWGYRCWPGVALGALLANAWTGVPVETVLGITLGNTLEALTGAYLLRRVAKLRTSLRRLRDILALVAFGAVISTMVSATIGVASLKLGDELNGSFGAAWRVWWLGDMTGDLIVAPFLLLFVGHFGDLRTRWRGRWIEAVVLALALGGASVLAFSVSVPIAYIVFPFLIWAALRFGPHGAATGSLIVAGIAIEFTVHGSGQFVRMSEDDSLLLSQCFVAIAALTALVLAAVAAEREDTQRESLEARRREALEINDNIVQGLAVAQYALELDRPKQAHDAIEGTLAGARRMIGELVGGDSDEDLAEPGALRRRTAADVASAELDESDPKG